MDILEKALEAAKVLRRKPTPETVEVPRHLRRVKTPAEYEEEDRLAREGASAAPKVKASSGYGRQLVPDRITNYGDN